jgi:hypothetical protein
MSARSVSPSSVTAQNYTLTREGRDDIPHAPDATRGGF